MPTLNWIGKDAVIRHHKEVPFRLLEADDKLSQGNKDEGNLIVQGDNLHALKALLPKYAGRVKCIYIDPPYNTGNEGWVYNDKVNSPEINKWLGQVVGKEAEDLSRHDKWLCMMYPRLMLLKQFLREDGFFLASIDYNEMHHLKILLDEVLGANCYKNTIAVRRGVKSVQAQFDEVSALSVGHEYILMYGNRPNLKLPKLNLNDEIGKPGKWDTFWRGTDRPTMRYELFGETPKSGQWRWEKNRTNKAISNYHYFKENIEPSMSLDEWFLENRTSANDKFDFVRKNETGKTQYYVPPNNGKLLSDNWMDILLSGSETTFDTEKNTKIIQRIVGWITKNNDCILDSFAGSGTTGHAVLKQNAEDGGNRKFILVEMEEKIAAEITAERVRRVSAGYTDAKGNAVAGLGSGFQFCRLSEEPLFNAFGDIREDVTFAELADFVWFSETGLGYSGGDDSPLLGTFHEQAVYLLFNGILGDRRPQGGNILTKAVLDGLPPHDGPKIIYAAATRLGPSTLQREQIIFKQTPYAIEV